MSKDPYASQKRYNKTNQTHVAVKPATKTRLKEVVDDLDITYDEAINLALDYLSGKYQQL